MNANEADHLTQAPKHDVVPVVIQGTTYSLSALFSIRDLEAYLDALAQGDGDRKALAVVISDKIARQKQTVPPIDVICATDEGVLSDFAVAIIDHDAELKRIFHTTDHDLPILQRFAVAQRTYVKNCAVNMAKALQPIIESFEQFQNTFVAQMSDTMLQMARVGQELSASISDSIFSSLQLIKDKLAEVSIPAISDERKNELIDAHQAWGKLGWAIIESAPDRFFFSCPPSIHQANKMAMKYCDKQSMKRLFVKMNTMRIKKEDLTEAIYCYENRCYRACAMILFSLIDAKLIRKQPKHSSKRRKTGAAAMVSIENKIKQEINMNDTLFFLLTFINLTSCISALFENGHDFSDEPTIINRHFVDHGMSTKRVRKRDCIQLFLVLYRLVSCLDLWPLSP